VRKRVPSHHLIPKKVQVAAKRPYQAIRYVSLAPSEAKKEIQSWLKTRKRRSSISTYLRKHTYNVDVIPQSELERLTPPSKSGDKYAFRHKVKEIKFVMVFKKPEDVEDLASIVILQNGGRTLQHTSEWSQKNKRTKFLRTKKTGAKIGDFRDYYKSLLKRPGVDEKRQLGAVLALIDLPGGPDVKGHVRVGSGIHGVEEAVINVSELKRGMVISHTSWKPGTLPHVVVEEKTPEGTKRLFLRSIDKEKEGEQLAQYKRTVRSLERKVLKDPANLDQKLELENIKNRLIKLSGEINIPIPPKWTEVTRLGHYGATQLEARHVKYPAPGEVGLDFIGKSGQRWNLKITDPDLARAIQDCQRGKSDREQIFPDIDRNKVAAITKKYKIAKPKDIRTFEGTKAFAEECKKYPAPKTKKELREAEKAIYKAVSQKLGNLPGTAKGAYVDPIVSASWKAGLLEKILKKSMLYVIIGEIWKRRFI